MPLLTDDELMTKINNAMQFHHATTGDMNGSFALIAQGFELVQEQYKRPDKERQTMLAGNMMSGAMIVYLCKGLSRSGLLHRHPLCRQVPHLTT